MSDDSLPNKLYTTKSMFTLGGSSAAVWIFCSVLEMVFQIDTDKYKWIGLLTALIISFVGTIDPKDMKLKLLMIAFFNGLMIYLNAVGIDSINQGISKARAARTTTQASLLPFTDGKAWWPTASLVDSLELFRDASSRDQSKIKSLEFRISQLTDSISKLTSSNNSLPVSSKNTSVKSVKISDASKEVSSGKVQGCEMVANSKSGIITFYMDCTSEVRVKLKGNGKHDISIRNSPDDGVVIKLDDNGKFAVTPKRSRLKLDIIVDGALCDTYMFVVKNLPVPTAKIEIDGKPYNEESGIPKTTKLLKLVPEIFDSLFIVNCPKDSRFEIKSLNLQINGNSSIYIKGSTINLEQHKIKPGDVIGLSNASVERTTFKGSTTPAIGNRMTVFMKVK